MNNNTLKIMSLRWVTHVAIKHDRVCISYHLVQKRPNKKIYDRVKENTDKDGHSDNWLYPTRIFTGDETEVVLNPEEGKFYAEKSYKQVFQVVTNKEKV